MKRFGSCMFSDEERSKITAMLAKRLPSRDLSSRSGPGNTKVTYVKSHRIIEIANQIFGFEGWSCNVVKCEVDFLDENPSTQKWSCGISALVQVSLKDGTSHEDVGYGMADNNKSKGMALEKAKKEAISDARKRCLRLFGNGLGNCIYDQKYVKDSRSGRANLYDESYDGPTIEGGLVSMNTKVNANDNILGKLELPETKSTAFQNISNNRIVSPNQNTSSTSKLVPLHNHSVGKRNNNSPGRSNTPAKRCKPLVLSQNFEEIDMDLFDSFDNIQ